VVFRDKSRGFWVVQKIPNSAIDL